MLRLPLARTAPLAAILFSAPSLATPADEVIALQFSSGGAIARSIEVGAGAILDGGGVNLDSITPGGLTVPRASAVVGSELWIGSDDGLYRYARTADAAAPFSFLAQLFVGQPVTAVSSIPGGAVLMLPGQVVQVDTTGTPLQTVSVTANYLDFLPYQGGYLASINSPNARIRILDSAFQLMGLFATDAETVAAQSSTGWFPRELTQLSDGRIAVNAQVSVGIIAADGTVEGVVSTCLFEQRVIETGGGLLLVPCADGPFLFDPDTFEVIAPGNSISSTPGQNLTQAFASTTAPSSSRYCSSTPNSSGQAARVSLLGSEAPDLAALGVVGSAMPAGSFALPIFGVAPYDVPFGNGRLCISPFSPGISRGPVAAVSDLGSASVQMQNAGGAAGAIFVPGSTWYFQYIFRDTTGFDTTDAVALTFQP